MLERFQRILQREVILEKWWLRKMEIKRRERMIRDDRSKEGSIENYTKELEGLHKQGDQVNQCLEKQGLTLEYSPKSGLRENMILIEDK